MRGGVPQGLVRRLTPLERYGLRLTLFGIAVVLVGAPFGLLLHQVTSDGPLTRYDEGWAQSLNDWMSANDQYVSAIEAVSFLGKPIFLYFAVGLPCLWLLRHGARKLVVFLVVTGLGGGIVDTLVKIAVARPRPEVEDPISSAIGKSFPSGHAMASTVCYGALLLVFLPLLEGSRRRLAIAATVALVAAIGGSRLFLGLHYVSDVLGGFVLGLAWLIAGVAAFEIWREERGRKPTHPLEEGVEPEEVEAAAADS